MNKYVLKYEAKLLLKNYTTLFFGILFPILMSTLIISGLISKIPANHINDAKRSIILTINIISPLSIFLIGHASVFPKDLEEGVYDRLELFSINQFSMAIYKFLVYYIFYLVSNIIYFSILINAFNIEIGMLALIKHTGYVTLICISAFFLSYGICLFTKKFSISFALCMGIYFITMILSGMMGISVEDMPKIVQKVAKLLPISHFSSLDYINELSGGFNYTFVQGLVVMCMISIIFFGISVYKNNR